MGNSLVGKIPSQYGRLLCGDGDGEFDPLLNHQPLLQNISGVIAHRASCLVIVIGETGTVRCEQN